LSSILDTIRDIWRVKITVSQVALSFLLAAFNWAVITTWTTYHFPKLLQGTFLFDLGFWGGLIFVLFWSLLLSLIGSVTSPERVVISPLDINIMTIGIYTVTLWTSLRPLDNLVATVFYGLALFITGYALVLFGLVQNRIAARAIGLDGSERELRRSIFQTDVPREEAADVISSHSKSKAIGLLYRDELEDGTICFYGKPDGVELYVGVSKRERGALLSIVAFEIHSFGIKQVDELWFRSRIASILTALKELQLKSAKGAVLPHALVDRVLVPTKGLFRRFQEAWKGLVRHIVSASVLAIADYWLWLNKMISQENAITLGFFIVLYLVAISVISRRKRLES